MLWVIVAVALAIGAVYASLGDRPAPRDRSTSETTTIVSVGDILLGDAAAATLETRGYRHPFARVQSLLAGADLVMGNLEGPITLAETPFIEDKQYTYKQAPEAVQALKGAGFGLLALGNNHALDYGRQGLVETMQLLHAAGVRTIGAGADEVAAREGTVIDVAGTRVGFLSYLEPYGLYADAGWFAGDGRPGVARLDVAAVREDVARLHALAEIVIVHTHFGRNYADVTPYQREIARQIIDAGADAVNGHHSHVAQGVEIYAGKPIIYSLGNFTFGTPGRFGADEPGYGLVARYNLAGGELVSVEFDLIATNNRLVGYQPRLLGQDAARRAWIDINIGFNVEAVWDGSTAVVKLPH